MRNARANENVVRSQIEIDEEITRLGVLIDAAHPALHPCIDAQILTLGERIRRTDIAHRWGRNDECHGTAVAAHTWMTGKDAAAPSETWEVFRSRAFGGDHGLGIAQPRS